MITLVIPEAPCSLNKLLRMHWAERRRYMQHLGKLVLVARNGKRPVEPIVQSRVHIERQSPKLLDKDNAYGSVKGLVDQLKIQGLVRDDSPIHMELTVTQKRGPAQTTIWIEGV